MLREEESLNTLLRSEGLTIFFCAIHSSVSLSLNTLCTLLVFFTSCSCDPFFFFVLTAWSPLMHYIKWVQHARVCTNKLTFVRTGSYYLCVHVYVCMLLFVFLYSIYTPYNIYVHWYIFVYCLEYPSHPSWMSMMNLVVAHWQ